MKVEKEFDGNSPRNDRERGDIHINMHIARIYDDFNYIYTEYKSNYLNKKYLNILMLKYITSDYKTILKPIIAQRW